MHDLVPRDVAIVDCLARGVDGAPDEAVSVDAHHLDFDSIEVDDVADRDPVDARRLLLDDRCGLDGASAGRPLEERRLCVVRAEVDAHGVRSSWAS